MDNEPQIISEDTTMSPTIGALALALSKAQGMMKAAEKDASNPHFGHPYASLDSCWDAMREPLSKNELAILQPPATRTDGTLVLTTMLAHSSGEWVKATIKLLLAPVGKAGDPVTMQSIGSAITYARRYGLSMVGVVADTDDDGNAASATRAPARRQERPAQAQQGQALAQEAEHICPVHSVAFKRMEKDGRVWYSHKDGDKWCNEDKLKAVPPQKVIPEDPEGPTYDDLESASGPTAGDYSPNGLLIAAKEIGWSSQQLLQRMRTTFEKPSCSLPNFTENERRQTLGVIQHQKADMEAEQAV